MGDSLPICEIREEFLKVLVDNGQCVLVAPTGSGKSTQAPQFLLDSDLDTGRLIIVLEPRRIAARTLASRVADERSASLGREVGYSIRFENRMSGGTRIVYVTEGVFLRWVEKDGFLDDVEAVFFDEFHERSLLSDVGLALFRAMRANLERPPYLIVMSATIEAEPVAQFLGGSDKCPIVRSEGRMFPVEVFYQDHRDKSSVLDAAVSAVGRIVGRGEEGDILVFMPGMGEIMSTVSALQRSGVGDGSEILPLHGDLSIEQQARAFARSDRRKIVVATNVAETSVTIPGVRHVVDGGLARVARYDASRGINTLLLEEISHASADQRAGRAGRTAPGSCMRLWNESNHLNRPKKNTPEIQRADLAESLLLLHSLGITDPVAFDWLDRPESAAIERAEELLENLGAVSGRGEERRLSEMGIKMMRLPMHPRYSRMILQGVAEDCVPEAALCAALVSGRDLLMRVAPGDSRQKAIREELQDGVRSDFQVAMRAFLWVRQQRFQLDACRQIGVHGQTARSVERTFQQLIEICVKEGLVEKDGMTVDPNRNDAIGRAALVGFVDQLGVRKDKGTLDCRVSGGREGTLVRESVMAREGAPMMFVVGDLREIDSKRRDQLTLISLASGVESEWLEELFPEQTKAQRIHEYDALHKRVQAWEARKLAGFELERRKVPDLDDRECGRCLAEAFFNDEIALPNWNHSLQQWVARCQLLAHVFPDLEFPRFERTELRDFLGEALKGKPVLKHAQEVCLERELKSYLGKDRIEWLDELVPCSIEIDGVGKRRLIYSMKGKEGGNEGPQPEIQIKVQECFPIQEHPKICDGRVAVRLKLQKPNGKRLAETIDWLEFKRVDYPKHRRELAAKFASIGWI